MKMKIERKMEKEKEKCRRKVGDRQRG